MKIYYVKFEREDKIYEKIFKEKDNAINMVELVLMEDDDLIAFKELRTDD